MDAPDPDPAPDADVLLGRFRGSGDTAALAALFDATAPGLFRSACHLSLDAAAAEDAVQETFLALLEAVRDGAPIRAAGPWLGGTLRNHALRARRTARRVPDLRRLPPPRAGADPADAAAREEEEARLRAALDGLPDPYREPALLRWRHGLEPAEIARVRGVAPGTVRSLLSRAADRIRAVFAGAALPALGFAPARGLGAVRAAVLRAARAPRDPPVPASVRPATAPVAAAALSGGALVTKKMIAAAVVAVLLLAAWGAWPLGDPAAGTRDAGAPSSSGGGARVPPRPSESSAPGEEPAAAGVAATAAAPPTPTPADGIVSLRVIVAWSDGTPAEGVWIVVGPRIETPMSDVRSAPTGADGCVTFPDLSAGTVFVRSDRDTRDVVDLAPGAGTDLSLRLPRGVDVEGRVLDCEDLPFADARVLVESRGAAHSPLAVARSGPDGTFHIRDFASYSTLVARAPGRAPSPTALASGAEGAVVRVTLRLGGAGGALAGTVRDPEGAPVAQAWVRVGSRDARMDEDGAGGYSMAAGPAFTRTDPEGRYRLDDLPAGILPAVAWAPGLAPVGGEAAVTAGGEAMLDLRLARGGSIAGSVRVDGEGRAGVRVAVVAAPPSAPAFHWFTGSGEGGDYGLRDLPAGTFEIEANHPGAGRCRRRVQVVAGAEARVDLPLDAGSPLRVRLVDEAGVPCASFPISVSNHARRRPDDERFFHCNVRTGADGRPTLPNCPDDRVTVTVFAPGSYPPLPFPLLPPVEVALDAGDATITVPRGAVPRGWIRGTVATPPGASPGAVQLSVRDARASSTMFHPDAVSGAFRIGPLRALVTLSVRLEGHAPLEVPCDLHALDGDLDLGTLRIAAPSFLDLVLPTAGEAPVRHLTATLFDDRGAVRRDLLNPAGNGPHRWGPLSPGRFRLALESGSPRPLFASLPVEIVEGETRRITAPLDAAARRFIVAVAPPGTSLPEGLSLTVRDGSGAAVLRSALGEEWSRPADGPSGPTGRATAMLTLPPGSYRVEVASPDGPLAAADIEMVDLRGTPPSTEIVLP